MNQIEEVKIIYMNLWIMQLKSKLRGIIKKLNELQELIFLIKKKQFILFIQEALNLKTNACTSMILLNIINLI